MPAVQRGSRSQIEGDGAFRWWSPPVLQTHLVGSRGRPMRLSGKRAVITGASRGLGRAVAEAFLCEGAAVLICARNADELGETQRALHETAPGRAFAKKCDVAMASDVDKLAEEARACLGG